MSRRPFVLPGTTTYSPPVAETQASSEPATTSCCGPTVPDPSPVVRKAAAATGCCGPFEPPAAAAQGGEK